MQPSPNEKILRWQFRLRDAVFYLFFRWLALPVIKITPLQVLYPAARLGGIVCWHLLVRERDRAVLNLRLAFADRLSARRLRLITQGMFIQLTTMTFECAELFACQKGPLWDNITGHDFGVATQTLAEGRGIVVLTAHFGNWELIGTEYFRRGFTGLVFSRKIRSPRFQTLVREWRSRQGVLEWYTDESPKALLTCLRKNLGIGVLNDQDIHRASGIFVDFFGIPAYTPRLVSELSYKTGAPLAPSFSMRRKNRTHVIRILPVIKPGEAEDKEAYIRRSMQEYCGILEKLIRRHPTQWVWFHRRWKTRPWEIARDI